MSKLGLEKEEKLEIRLPTFADYRDSKGISEKHLSLFHDYAKAFDCVNHDKLWKVLSDMVIADHFTCLLRNLYAGQEATVRTQYGTTDWLKIEKGV